MSKKAILIGAGALLAIAGAAAAIAEVGNRDGRFGHRWMDRGGGHHGGGMRHGGDDDGSAFMREGRRGGWHGRRGSMSAEEFDSRTRERFARLDKNSDGVIDSAEVQATIEQRGNRRQARVETRVGRMLARFDTNKDGKISREEFLDRVKARFARMDLNNDGRITDEDLPPVMRGRDVLKGGPASDGPGFGRGRGNRAGFMLGRIRAADANNDGIITLDEVLAQAGKRFDQMDRNKDGTVDKADFDGLQKEMVAYRVQRFIHNFGADKDGKVTREQFFAAAKERFASRDINADGRIDRQDFGGGRGGRHGMDRGRGGPDGRMGPGSPGGPGGPGGPSPDQPR